jgi:hypothetical protein
MDELAVISASSLDDSITLAKCTDLWYRMKSPLALVEIFRDDQTSSWPVPQALVRLLPNPFAPAGQPKRQ